MSEKTKDIKLTAEDIAKMPPGRLGFLLSLSVKARGRVVVRDKNGKIRES